MPPPRRCCRTVRRDNEEPPLPNKNVPRLKPGIKARVSRDTAKRGNLGETTPGVASTRARQVQPAPYLIRGRTAPSPRAGLKPAPTRGPRKRAVMWLFARLLGVAAPPMPHRGYRIGVRHDGVGCRGVAASPVRPGGRPHPNAPYGEWLAGVPVWVCRAGRPPRRAPTLGAAKYLRSKLRL